jgi:hypothetical protein
MSAFQHFSVWFVMLFSFCPFKFLLLIWPISAFQHVSFSAFDWVISACQLFSF